MGSLAGGGGRGWRGPALLRRGKPPGPSRGAPPNAGGAPEFTGAGGGAGGLRMQGPGLLTLGNAASTYTGATTIDGGTLRFNGTGAAASTTAVIVNAGGR